MRHISTRAFAKINHFLNITGRRGDGYHLICSHMQAVDLCDNVQVELDPPARGGPMRVEVAMDAPWRRGLALPQGEDNIAHRAAASALRIWGGCAADGSGRGGLVRVRILKRIPMAAGLAGGSADAAAAMLALAHMLAPAAPLADVMAAGAEIGADVPFCMAAIAHCEPALGYAQDPGAGASFICGGIGDAMEPADPVRGFAVLVKPCIDVPTPRVYGEFDSMPPGSDGAAGGNDLEAPAVRLFPRIGAILGEVRDFVRQAGGDGPPPRVFMTGSGPTVVALYEDSRDAALGYARLAGAYENRADIGAVIQAGLLT